MKKISEHLGQIIIALAGVALLIAACVVFKEPIGDFYNSIVGKEVSVAGDVLAGVEDPNLSDLTPDGGNESIQVIQVFSSLADGYNSGYLLNGIVGSTTNESYTNLIDVDPGSTYFFKNPQASDKRQVVATYNSEKAHVASYSKVELSSLAGSYAGTSYDKEVYYITIPEGIEYISIVGKNAVFQEGFYVYKNSYEGETHSYVSKLSNSNNNLKGKKVLFFGDSITEGLKTMYESYASYIAEANSMTYMNQGVSGTKASGLYYDYKSIREAFITHSSKSTYDVTGPEFWNSLTEDDFVIVAGFVNDYNSTIGELTPAGTTEFDNSTFTGALEEMCYYYKYEANCPAKLGFVLTHQWASAPQSHKDVVNAAISVFEKYDMQYLNLFDKTYELCDGLHPSFDGQLAMAADVEAWMNTLN